MHFMALTVNGDSSRPMRVFGHPNAQVIPSLLNTTFYHKGNGLIPARKLKSFSEWYRVGHCRDIHGARQWFRGQAPGSNQASSNSNPVQFRHKNTGRMKVWDKRSIFHHLRTALSSRDVMGAMEAIQKKKSG